MRDKSSKKSSYERMSNIIAWQIRMLRKRQVLSEADLAEKIGLSEDVIENIENGQIMPDIGTLIDIAVALEKRLEIKFV